MIGVMQILSKLYQNEVEDSLIKCFFFLSVCSGLGLLEYMTFLEDTGMTPIMAVWDGTLLDSVLLSGLN